MAREVKRLKSEFRQYWMANRVFVRNLRDHRLRVCGVPRMHQNRHLELIRQRTHGVSVSCDMPMRDNKSGRSESAGSQLLHERRQYRKIRVDEESASGAQHYVCVRG
jgi:hypothetical protein